MNHTVEKVAELWRPFIMNVCGQYLRNARDAEDCCQTALLKVWLKLHTFDGRSNIKSWLYRVAANEALQLRRRNSLKDHPDRLPERGIDLDAAFREIERRENHGAEQDAFNLVYLNELREVLIEAISRAKYPNNVISHLLWDKQSPEISQESGQSLAAVKSQLHRDREAMRRFLKARGFGHAA